MSQKVRDTAFVEACFAQSCGDRVPQALEGQAFFDKAFILKGGLEAVPNSREAVVSLPMGEADSTVARSGETSRQSLYDQRSLMPHQVFFPMADAKGGWNWLKKTIRAELDEDLLEQFHGTVSLPFEAGDNKRIAVKIVDDRGIESRKIVALEG